jgi:hypothetical protein
MMAGSTLGGISTSIDKSSLSVNMVAKQHALFVASMWAQVTERPGA